MSNVIDMKTRQPCAADRTAPVDPDVLERIRWLLQAAEAGEIDGAVMAYTYRDGATAYRMAGPVCSRTMLGTLECIKAQILKSL